MATQPVNKQILYKKTLTFWAKASATVETFDITNPLYGGPLDFTPDAFIVRNVSYISNNEQNKDQVPCITSDFGQPIPNGPCFIGIFSAQGSINNKGTYHEFVAPDPNPNLFSFEVVLLDGKDNILVNTQISKSSWFTQIEFIKYVDDPIFE
jgi:hypothetical protein